MEHDPPVNRHVKSHLGRLRTRARHHIIEARVARLYLLQRRLEEAVGLQRQNSIILVELPKRQRRYAIIGTHVEKETVRLERYEMTQRMIALVVRQQKRKPPNERPRQFPGIWMELGDPNPQSGKSNAQ